MTSRTTPPRRDLLPFALACATILAVFAWNVGSHAFLSDDAFISFRYAQNLVEGHGLTFNPGERVEGYTNFLWVLMAAGGLRAGLAPESLSPVLGIASGALVLALITGLGVWRHGWRDPFVLLVPAVLALHRSFAAWCTSGLETQFFALLVLGGLVALLAERRCETRWPWASSLVLALATLTRPEGAIFAAGGGVLFAVDVVRRRRRAAALLVWAAPLLLLVGGHLLWRHSYYGEWLPNTFHAKVNGIWLEQGVRYLGLFHADFRAGLLLPLALLALAARRDALSCLFAGVVAAQVGYLAGIGGDFLEFRFLVPMLPCFYWLVIDGLRIVAGWRFTRAAPSRLGPALALVGAALLLVATHLGSVSPEARVTRHGVEGIDVTRRYGELRIDQGRALRRYVAAGRLPADLRIETGAIGALPYYTGWYTLDKRGLTDLRIARAPLLRRGQVGHEHAAPLGYVKARRIAVLLLGHRLLHRSEDGDLASLRRRALGWVEAYNAEIRDPAVRLRLECRELDPGRLLIFGTNLDEDDFHRVLGHLPRC